MSAEFKFDARCWDTSTKPTAPASTQKMTLSPFCDFFVHIFFALALGENCEFKDALDRLR